MTDQLKDVTSGSSARTTRTGSMASIARGSTINLVGAVAMGASTFLVTVAVTRGLSQVAAGVFFSVTSLFMLATSIGQLGTGAGLVYFLSRCRVLGTRDQIGQYLRAATRPVMVSALLMAVGTFVFAPELAELTNPDQVERATQYLRVLAVFIPFAGLENVGLAATRGLGTMRANALVEQIGRPVLQLCLVALAVWLTSGGLLGWAWAFAYAPAAVVAWLWWKKLRPRVPVPGGSLKGKGLEFWRFSGPRALTSVIQIVMQRFDIVLVGALGGAVDAAVYAAATRFVVAGQMGSNAVSTATQPRLAEALALDDHDGTNHIYQTSTAWLMAITWPLYLTFIVFGKPLLHVFGKGYSAGMAVLLLVSLAMLVSTGCGMVDMVLTMAGRTSWNLANAILALAAMLGLDLWLIPSHGVLGAAIGWAAAIAVRNLAALVQVGAAMRLHPFGRPTAVVAALSAVCFAGVAALSRLLLGPNALGLAAGLLVGGACYAVGLYACRGPLQLASLRAVVRRRKPAAHS